MKLKTLLLTVLLSISLNGVAYADFNNGLKAYQARDYATALKEWEPLAEQGHTSAQYNLGRMYEKGEGVPQNYKQAVNWYLKAAKQGNTKVWSPLSTFYALGLGVNQDDSKAIFWQRKAVDKMKSAYSHLPGAAERGLAISFLLLWSSEVHSDDNIKTLPLQTIFLKESVRWFKLSADLGNVISQGRMAEKYKYGGQGFPQDYVLSYMWANIVASTGYKEIGFTDVGYFIDELKKVMTPYQISRAQELSRNWEQKESGKTSTTNKTPKQKEHYSSSGTGFRVDKKGMLITNYHVVKGCSDVKVNGNKVVVKSTDSRNDLALLQGSPSSLIPYFRAGRSVRLGDDIIIAGYPLQSVLGSGLNVTTGTVASLSGLGNNTSRMQITAPINSGNSGGPVFDNSGRIVGVVVSKINTTKAREILGEDIQGANFAIKGSVVRSFLDMNDVDYEVSSSNKNMSTADIAENAKEYTALIKCWK